MSMGKYLAQRLLAIATTLIVVSLFVFLLLRFVPGDPVMLLVGESASPEELARVRAEWGLDRSLPEQYLTWIENVARGDLGNSLITGEPVTEALWRHFSVTLQLVLLAFFLSAVIAAPLGVIAAWRRGSHVDYAIVGLATLLTSAPSFWIAMLLIMVFGAGLGWLPTLGFVPIHQNPVEWFAHILLPVTALVCVEVAILTRIMRASTIEVLGQDYVAFARSKGLPERVVLNRHVLINAFAPCLTMLGLVLSSLLSGTVIIESIFAIPGLGRFMVDSIYARDYPNIQGVLLFVVLLYSVINLIVDMLYPLLNPKARQA